MVVELSGCLSQYLSGCGLGLQDGVGEDFLGLVEGYYALSQKWGSKINITANLGVEDYVRENVLDPLLAFGVVSEGLLRVLKSGVGLRVIDLGCGGGYVGVIWSILARCVLGVPVKVVLVDTDRKKINFCKQVGRELGLDLEAVQSEAGSYLSAQSGLVEAFQLLVTRATWPFEKAFGVVEAYLENNAGSAAFCALQSHSDALESQQFSKKAVVQCYELPGGVKRAVTGVWPGV